MRKAAKNISIFEKADISFVEMYTGQTIISLFRCLLESVIENSANSVVILNVNDSDHFRGLLNRLKYSESNVFVPNESEINSSFNNLPINDLKFEEQFLVIAAERFSACLCWGGEIKNNFELYSAYSSLNPNDVNSILSTIQDACQDECLKESVKSVKQDRRANERFTSILRKTANIFDAQSRDLLCLDSEVQLLQDKIDKSNNVEVEKALSVIAHEIRNPLSSIILYSKIIKSNLEKSEIEPAITAAETIMKSAERLSEQLSEMIDMSKPVTMKLSNSNLVKVIKDAISEVLAMAEHNGITIVFEPFSEDVWHPVDVFKLIQVIINLLKNAVEACVNVGVVNVKLVKSSEMIEILISDNGKGIPSSILDRIFTPFFTTKAKGSGIGLAYSKKLIQTMGGDLKLISTGSGGTTFGIYFNVSVSY